MGIFRKILFGLLALFAVWFIVFGGEFFGSTLDTASEKVQLHKFVYGCQQDEMRLRFYASDLNAFLSVTVNFSTGKLIENGGDLGIDNRTGLFWSRKIESVFHTITFPLANPPSFYTPDQIHRIQRLLSELAANSKPETGSNSSDNECYLAFYESGVLKVETLSPRNCPSQVKDICGIIGFSPVYDYWNSLRKPDL